MQNIIDKICNSGRISDTEALTLYREGDLYLLGFLANSMRQRLHPEPLVTYVIDRNINYTDICLSACKFCAFFKAPEDESGYVLSFEELGQKILETKALGGTQVLLQGGLHPDLPFSFYEEMLRFMKGYDIHIHGFSPPEVQHFAKIAGLSMQEVIERLREAGLDSIPGGGAEILSDRVRSEVAPRKCTADQWIEVMECAHNLGMRTTATMMFGHIETDEEMLEHLRRIRDLQDRTGGFTAFIPWPFQPTNTVLAHIQPATGFRYLKILALSRIYLDNVANIQASWVTQGPKIAQLALSFGANDFGSTMIEENVVAAAGVTFRMKREEIVGMIQDAGFTAAQRDTTYRILKTERGAGPLFY